MRSHWRPALGLFFLAPLVGEFLLGNLPITWLWALFVLAPLYGGGALLVRETARRLRLGWPGMILLALAYAVIEEAFVTQSLFNRDYLGLGLLEYGYIPVLGIGVWWTVFVLAIHVIWSISVPIALVESLTPHARETPWLGRLGMVITGVLFLIGCVLTYFTQGAGVASAGQLIASAVIAVGLVAAAVMVRRKKSSAPRGDTRPAPGVLQVVAAMFLLSSAFLGWVNANDLIPVALDVALMLGTLAAGGLLLWQWARRAGWGEPQRFGAAAGLLLTYAWYGFVQPPSAEGVSLLVDAVGNAVFAAAAILLLGLTWRKVAR